MKPKVHNKLINTHILNSCFSKVPHKTEDAARQAAAEIARQRGDQHVMQSYHCGFCNKYHLTKMTLAKTKRTKDNKITLNNFGLRKTKERWKKAHQKKNSKRAK